MSSVKTYVTGRIAHLERKVSDIKRDHGGYPNETHNYFGGQTIGYWQGRLSAFMDVLDEIEAEEVSVDDTTQESAA